MTNENNNKVTIFVIATKSYGEYALNLIKSSLKWSETKTQLEFILLRDKQVVSETRVSDRDSIVVKTFQIPSYGWPEATLLRFHLILDHWEHVTGEIVMYLDADTEIVAPLSFSDLSKANLNASSNGITPVLHPGYYNRSWARNIMNRTRFGPWENNRNSSAFVPYKFRENYVCGGVFWGLKEAFHQLCTSLKVSVDHDLKLGIFAKHNDESHLNSWLVNNPTFAASPEWAYADGYQNLSNLIPRVKVIHKPSSFVRTPTESS
jgi:hypothetical protein